MKTIVVCVAAGLVLLAAVAAWAQNEPQTAYQARTYIKFTEITIPGEIQHPGAEIMFARTPPDFAKKVELKASFLPELLQSVDKL